MSFASSAPSTSSASTTNTVVYDSDDSDYIPEPQPELPYEVGSTFLAKRHKAPPPFGSYYDNERPHALKDWEELGQLELCRLSSPMEGITYEDQTRTLKITDCIRTGYQCGAQVVVVNGDLVAKIYDPLYYAWLNEFNVPENVIIDADQDYTREAAAYDQLDQLPEAQNYTPKYYGSWTMEVETRVGKFSKERIWKRQVRLILMEHVQGTRMDRIHPKRLLKKARSNILVKVLEADAVIFYAGVTHRDVVPRNIIVQASNYHDPRCPDLKVKIVDFNYTIVHKMCEIRNIFYSKQVALHAMFPGKLNNPIKKFWRNMLEFQSWEWISQDQDEVRAWLWKHFGTNEKYIPMQRNKKYPDKLPRIKGCDLWKEYEDNDSEYESDGDEQDREGTDKVIIEKPLDNDVKRGTKRARSLSIDTPADTEQS